jgi:4-amino-4-deoxy-L-arabinose transferase-like glycosyltransferase
MKRSAPFFDRETSLAMLATAAALAPFLNKAYHIDDTIFLRMARQILAHRFSPFDFQYNWTVTPVPAWAMYLNPPLDSYFLAAVGAVVREREFWTHLAFLPFAAACAALMLKLSRRFCGNARAAACLCLVSPAFFVSATNVMADVPLLAFWLAAVYWTVEAAEPGRERLLWAAGTAAAAAAMTKYFGLALVPLALVYWTVKTRRATPHLAAFLLAPAAVALWSLYSWPRAGFLHPLGSAAFGWETARDWRLSAAAAAAFLGGGAAWPLALAPVWARAGRGARTALGLAALAALAAGLHVPAARAECAEMAFAGILLGATALAGAASRPDPESLLLLLWLSGTVAFAGLFNWTVNERALLPAFFPAAALTIRWLESRESGRLWLRRWPWAAAPAFALSFLLALADQGHAGAARDFAASRVRPLVAAGVPVRFIGHWGFQYYMEKAGAEAFDYAHPALPPGARLCVSLNNTATLPTPEPLRSSLIREAAIPYPNGWDVQLTDVQGESAGFYGSVFGAAPYSFGRGLTSDIFLIEHAPGKELTPE